MAADFFPNMTHCIKIYSSAKAEGALELEIL